MVAVCCFDVNMGFKQCVIAISSLCHKSVAKTGNSSSIAQGARIEIEALWAVRITNGHGLLTM